MVLHDINWSGCQSSQTAMHPQHPHHYKDSHPAGMCLFRTCSISSLTPCLTSQSNLYRKIRIGYEKSLECIRLIVGIVEHRSTSRVQHELENVNNVLTCSCFLIVKRCAGATAEIFFRGLVASVVAGASPNRFEGQKKVTCSSERETILKLAVGLEGGGETWGHTHTRSSHTSHTSGQPMGLFQKKKNNNNNNKKVPETVELR